jgi:hypothetical protein
MGSYMTRHGNLHDNSMAWQGMEMAWHVNDMVMEWHGNDMP